LNSSSILSPNYTMVEDSQSPEQRQKSWQRDAPDQCQDDVRGCISGR